MTSRSKAQDPDIRRVAEEAETRLTQNTHSGYTPWPTAPPPGPPSAPIYRYMPPQPDGGQPNGNCAQPYAYASPSPENDPAVDPALQGPQGQATTTFPGSIASYASPYGYTDQTDPKSVGSDSGEPTPTTNTDLQGNSNRPPSLPSDVSSSHGPPLQSVVPIVPDLSRRRQTKILLSIDGDGVRGLSSLLVIESLVNAICAKVGQRLDPHQIFDLAGGSSLGGVIAILLCRLRMQVHRARDAYRKIAKQVFANKRDFFRSLDPQASPPNADGVALEQTIKSVIKQELDDEDEFLFNGREETGDVYVQTLDFPHHFSTTLPLPNIKNPWTAS